MKFELCGGKASGCKKLAKFEFKLERNPDPTALIRRYKLTEGQANDLIILSTMITLSGKASPGLKQQLEPIIKRIALGQELPEGVTLNFIE